MGGEKTRRGDDRERETEEEREKRKKERERRGGKSQSLTNLPRNNSIVPTPSAGDEAVVVCVYTSPLLSVSSSLNPPQTALMI